MKKTWIFKRLLCLLLLCAALCCFGCESKKEKEAALRREQQQAVDLQDEEAMLALADHRVLLTSDIHYTYLTTWYGATAEERTQAWVDAVLYEHSLRPFDLIVIMGDVSLDHWEWNGGGTYLKDGVSTTKTFMENYVSQLPADVPVFVLAGNHEQFGNAKWKELTGNDRQGSIVLGNDLYLFLDSYAEDLDPDHHHDGVATAPDVAFARAEMEKYPDHNVYLISHAFSMKKGGKEFAKLVSEPRVVALFQGHTHRCNVDKLGADYAYKKVMHTGNFSYTGHDDSAEEIRKTFWGFRDLVTVGDRSVTRYIVAESRAKLNGVTLLVPRQLRHVEEFSVLPPSI